MVPGVRGKHCACDAPCGGSEFQKATMSLFDWVSKRGLPGLLSNPVVWREREANKMADYLANRSMDLERSWKWQAAKAEEIVDSAIGIVCFSDGGFRPKHGVGAAGWVAVAIFEDIGACSNFSAYSSSPYSSGCSPSITNNIDFNYYNDFSNSSYHCAEKLAEGAMFLPACRSSFEAELIAVRQLTMHIGHLMTRRKPSVND